MWGELLSSVPPVRVQVTVPDEIASLNVYDTAVWFTNASEAGVVDDSVGAVKSTVTPLLVATEDTFRATSVARTET